MRVLYTAAHGGAPAHVPIGGGGAIASMLRNEWQAAKAFELVEIRPQDASPQDIVAFTQSQYGDFCYRFRSYSTNQILREDPKDCVVLANDISEGPDFALLARHGYRVFTIWHVDVVAFVARMHFKGWVQPHTLVKLMRPIESLLPPIAKLAFQQQRECVHFCTGHIVMTDAMKQTILRCYPETTPEKIHVIPWGAPPPPEGIGQRMDLPGPVLLTLSRISPEKGLGRLIRALAAWKGQATLLICGAAAYMDGEAALAEVQRLAGGLKNVKVVFAGHVSGQAKLDAFASADLYLFPSQYESYGLTLMEALSHGVPAIAYTHEGAKAILRPEFGELVGSDSELLSALDRLLANPARRAQMSIAAREYARANPFSTAASRLANLLLGV